MIQKNRGPGRSKCLCCSNSNGKLKGKVIYVADGNFSFKKHAGHASSISKSLLLLKSSFFLEGAPPGVVLPDSKSYCSNFRSGDDISKGNSMCDINGVYLSACSHAIPHSVQDIIKGENLGYGIKFLESLKAEYGRYYSSKIAFRYDIVCLLDSHIRKRKLTHLLPDTIFTPEMHARSHIEYFQISTSVFNQLDLDVRMENLSKELGQKFIDSYLIPQQCELKIEKTVFVICLKLLRDP